LWLTHPEVMVNPSFHPAKAGFPLARLDQLDQVLAVGRDLKIQKVHDARDGP